MSAGRYDIVAEKGSTFNLELTYQNSDNTGFEFDTTDGYNYAVRMQIRKSANQVGTRTPVLHITTNNTPTDTTVPDIDTDGLGGGVIYFTAATDGKINIKIPSTTMDDIAPKRYFYDIELYRTDGTDEVTKILKGTFDVEGEVTV